MIRKILTKLKSGTEPLNYGREALVDEVVKYVKREKLRDVHILDIGLGSGCDLLNVRDVIQKKCKANACLLGVEVYPPYVAAARAHGIEVIEMDIERNPIAVPNESLNIVIANQIIEHTKEVFWIFSEISRVLKPGGIAVIGVPNLASFHNRIALLFGMQPTCIEPLSAHVRGFTRDGFQRLIECDEYFKLQRTRGSNFYPFPPILSRPMSVALPSMAVCAIFTVRRTHKSGVFIDVLKTRKLETPYFIGATRSEDPSKIQSLGSG